MSSDSAPRRVRTTLRELVLAVAEETSTPAETVTVLRHLFETRRLRFADVPLVREIRATQRPGSERAGP